MATASTSGPVTNPKYHLYPPSQFY